MPTTAFQLPTVNEEVSIEKIKEICDHFKLHRLWEKIKNDPPTLTFSSDGCTMWPNETNGKDIYAALLFA